MNESLGSGAKPAAASATDPLGANGEIARKLKQYYDGLVSKEVPDRFAQLLSELEAAERAREEG